MIVQAAASLHGAASVSALASQVMRGAIAARTAPRSTAVPIALRRAAAPIRTAATLVGAALINGQTPVADERTMTRPYMNRAMLRPFVDRTMVRPASETP